MSCEVTTRHACHHADGDYAGNDTACETSCSGGGRSVTVPAATASSGIAVVIDLVRTIVTGPAATSASVQTVTGKPALRPAPSAQP